MPEVEAEDAALNVEALDPLRFDDVSTSTTTVRASMLIKITDWLSIDDDDLVEEFMRSSGPGGQNVNKLATAVQFRFSAGGMAELPE